MWMNYIKIAWRNLSRNRMFSIINILGLAIGIAASLLILQYVSRELSYDNFHEKETASIACTSNASMKAIITPRCGLPAHSAWARI